MQQSRQYSFLDGENDLMPMGDGEGAEGRHDEAGNIDLDDGNDDDFDDDDDNRNDDDDDDDDLFLEEAPNESAPLLSDAVDFWGASAAPGKVAADIEAVRSAFAAAQQQGQRADLVLVRERERERERRRKTSGDSDDLFSKLTPNHFPPPASFPSSSLPTTSENSSRCRRGC